MNKIGRPGRRVIIAGVVFGVIVCGAILRTGLSSQTRSAVDKDIAVAVAKVGRSDLSEVISITGEMRPYQQTDLHAKVAGYLQAISVDIGDHVKMGSPIAVLEIPELREELTRSQAATAAAEEHVKSVEAKYEDQHRSLERLLTVAKNNQKLIAQQDIDTATSRDQAAKAEVALARLQVGECKATQDKMETMMSYATITAPFDGVITKRYADKGALIQTGISSSTQAMPVVSLAQDTMLRASFPLPESIVDQLKVGDAVTIRLPDLNKTIKGRISRFSRQVERATRTMEAQVDVPNPDWTITPGMYAVANFRLESRTDVLVAPVQAVKSGSSPSVFVVNDKNQLEKRDVGIGLQTADQVEITSGLNENDRLVIGNTGELREGMRVTSQPIGLAETPLKKVKTNG